MNRYDFVDLEEDDDDDDDSRLSLNFIKYFNSDILNLKFNRFNSPIPEPSNLQKSKSKSKSSSQENCAIFIRSDDYDSNHQNYRLNEEKLTSSSSSSPSSELSIILQNKNNNLILKFDPKSSFKEGRDSRVHRGHLHLQDQDIDKPAITVAVAIKIYKNDSSALAGAQKEIKIAEITQGRPDFLKLYYSGTLELPDPSPSEFISVWEWIEGGTLDLIISNNSIIKGIDGIHEIIKSLANSLNFLHSHHIIHHDLKPQNILLNPTLSRIVLIDFGDSKMMILKSSSSSSSSSNLPVNEGIGLGTLAYTAPELLSTSASSYDPFAVDVYSFGVLLFYLLNFGKIDPFSSLLPHRSVHLILTAQKGFFLGGYNPDVRINSPFYQLMKMCLQVNPLERPKFPEIINRFF